MFVKSTSNKFGRNQGEVTLQILVVPSAKPLAELSGAVGSIWLAYLFPYEISTPIARIEETCMALNTTVHIRNVTKSVPDL